MYLSTRAQPRKRDGMWINPYSGTIKRPDFLMKIL